MPVLSTVGAASLRAFGAFRSGAPAGGFIAATGGTVYTDPTNANYKIHQFTSSGTFSITNYPVGATLQVMMVGGGGGGTFGGGGAGGYIYRSSLSLSTGSFAVTVGSGGNAGASGSNTLFGGLTALGGGSPNFSGGSGGGGVDQNGAVALQPSSASGGYGNKGGDWSGGGFDGGGGGAGSAGSVPDGGSGRTADIISSTGTYAQFAAGGYGVDDSVAYALPAVVANSGNGGWGGGDDDENANYVDHGAGQAGIVRIRYLFQ
jgi:hypothetical protein